MLTKINERITRRRDEKGNDVVVTLFMIVFFIGLLFAIVEVSTYFQTKTQVHNITRDGARIVALMGGASNSISLNKEKFGGNGVNVANYVRDKLADSNGNCIVSRCTQPPVVTCGPTVATQLTADAYCSVTYYYGGVTGNLIGLLGFDAITTQTIQTRESFKVETSW